MHSRRGLKRSKPPQDRAPCSAPSTTSRAYNRPQDCRQEQEQKHDWLSWGRVCYSSQPALMLPFRLTLLVAHLSRSAAGPRRWAAIPSVRSEKQPEWLPAPADLSHYLSRAVSRREIVHGQPASRSTTPQAPGSIVSRRGMPAVKAELYDRPAPASKRTRGRASRLRSRPISRRLAPMLPQRGPLPGGREL